MFQSESHVELIKDLPTQAYWQALEASSNLRLEDLKAAKTYSEIMQGLRDEYIEKFYALIGKTKLKKYLSFHNKRIEMMRKAREEVLTKPDGFKLLEEIRKRSVEESRKIIERSGVDIEVVTALQKQYHEKALVAARETVCKGEVFDPEKSVKGKNQTFSPPYSGWIWGFAWNTVGRPSVPAFSHFLNSNTGEAGSQSLIQVRDADDAESASVVYRTAIRQWFQMPSRGQVRARATIEGISASHSGSIADECGGSRVTVDQGARVYYQVIVPYVSSRVYDGIRGGGYGTPITAPSDRGREYSYTWSEIGLATGAIYNSPSHSVSSSRYAVIPGVIETGTWVLVDIGIETVNNFSSNNYTVNSNLMDRYWIREIGLSSTG